MKSHSIPLILAFLILAFHSMARAEGSPTAMLDGTWTSEVKMPGGIEVVTVMVIDKGNFSHRVSAGGKLQFYSEGKVALEVSKSISLMAFTGVTWGHSEKEKLELGEDRHSPFILHGEKLHMANNFDKLRKDEPPKLDVFEKNVR